MALRYEQLSVDTDAYLAISERLLAGDGFCSVAGQPTAYRPPLFPLLVAIVTRVGGTFGLAVLQVGLGVGTIVGTSWLAVRVGLSDRGALLAAGVVAVDPMLLLYSSQAMTEVLMTALTVAFFAAIWSGEGSRCADGHSVEQAGCLLSQSVEEAGSLQTDSGGPPELRVKPAAMTGLAFGLLALCRPSIWPFGILVLAAGLLAELWKLRLRARQTSSAGDLRARGQMIGAFLLGALLVLLPWCARNAIVFGRPIITTTHGGYTALLGNNDSYYEAVASQPFGAVWSGASFEHWQHGVEVELDRRGIAKTDELARDAAMMTMAREWIVQHPDRFGLAAWSRFRNLWSPVPMQSGELPSLALLAVGVGYVVLFALALAGAMSSRIDRRFRCLTLLMVLSLTALHLVFWANARMRCPTHPLLAILAAGGLRITESRRRDAVRTEQDGSAH